MNRRNFVKTSTAGAGAGLGVQAANLAAATQGATPASKYYDFSSDGRECLIHRYDTPTPWLNLLGNDRLVAWVTHSGNIVECCLINNRSNRITNPGSGYLYVRDAVSGEHILLNRPKAGAEWRAVQGLGFTGFTTKVLGVTASCTYFVPREDDVLLWLVTLRNEGRLARTLDVFGLVEWCLGDVSYDSTLPGGDFRSLFNNFKKVSFTDGALLGENFAWGTLGAFQGQKSWPYMGFFASSLPVKSHETDKQLFFGRTGNLENPAAVRRGVCGNKVAFGYSDFPLGVLHHSLTLKSGAEEKFVLVLGLAKSRDEVLRLKNKYANAEAAKKALAGVKAFWSSYTGNSLTVSTPEKESDRLINIWIKYQTRASMLQNLNTGRRGLGIWCPAYSYGARRMSDIREAGNVPVDLELVRENLLDYLENRPLMLESDLEMRWNEPARPATPFPYPHDGRGLWPYPVCWYIQETGDFAVLETRVDFRGQNPWMPKTGSASLFDAMKIAVEWSQSGLSARGLPRLVAGYGDWNDGVNLISRDGRGETVLTALEICYMLRECAGLARRYGKSAEAADWMHQYERIKAAVNEYAWDGNWYVRAFTDEGEPVGSSKNAEGQIYLEVQALAVLSGVADADRAAKCLKSVDDHLLTELGPRICAPYTKPDYHVGITADFGPGWRENAGIWNRTTGWTIMANCLAGRANEAFEMYRRASVHNASKNIDRFWLPPYAYPEYYVGVGPDFGRAQFQWCMGKAGTMWRAFAYYILGVRPAYDGLLLDPQIPNQWPDFELTRPFRGARYEIHVRNPNRVNAGVRSFRLDGRDLKGNIVPSLSDGKLHRVEIDLGA